MEKVFTETQDSILASWVGNAVEAYKEAAALQGVEAERAHSVKAKQGYVSAALLRPSYVALSERYRKEVNDGLKTDMFFNDNEDVFRREWVAFALNYMRWDGRAHAQRWILQASIGLRKGVAPSAAANMLMRYILDSPLEGQSQ